MDIGSIIATRTQDGKLLAIYCHFDGDPNGVGNMLRRYYTDPKKILQLFDLGDLCSLGKRLSPAKGKEHSYDKPAANVTVAYRRDRGDIGARTIARIIDAPHGLGEEADVNCAEYIWLYDQDSKVWSFAKMPHRYNSSSKLRFNPYP